MWCVHNHCVLVHMHICVDISVFVFACSQQEAEVRVYPSQQPVDSTPSELTPRQMHEQLLRQRMRERQQIQQQRQLQSGYANQGQEPGMFTSPRT